MAIQSNAADIHLRSSQALGLSSLTPFSVTTWINATWNAGATASFVGIYGPATDDPSFAPVTAMQIGTQTGSYDLVCWTWGGGQLVSGPANTMSGFNGQWVFITYTYDGTTHRLYRNGALLSSSTNSQITGYLNQVYINGFPGSGTSEVASFQTDQYALYRRALKADEVLSIYNAGGARHGINNGLICRYEYDELSQGVGVSSVPDLTGNGNTLTLVGAGANMTYTYTNSFANSNIRPVQ
jgi:hypothetical protein